MRVLVVEDEEALRELLNTRLQEHGLTVHVAPHAGEAARRYGLASSLSSSLPC